MASGSSGPEQQVLKAPGASTGGGKNTGRNGWWRKRFEDEGQTFIAAFI